MSSTRNLSVWGSTSVLAHQSHGLFTVLFVKSRMKVVGEHGETF